MTRASELQAFAGLPQALGRLLLRDGRSRKEIADAAQINASMLSGYCSGRRIPSLEHLDRILTTLGVGVEELTYELRALDYRSPGAPLVLWPGFLGNKEGAAAATLLTTLLEEVRNLLRAQPGGAGERPPLPPEVTETAAEAPAGRGARRPSGGSRE